MRLIFAAATLEVVVGYGAASLRGSSDCCTILSQNPALVGTVIFPDSGLFQNRLDTYWSLSAAVAPWCMAIPEDTEQVSVLMKTISELECPFGLRGGGHGTHELSNSVKEGVTIDMGYFNTTTYHPSTSLASIGPGTHWGEVYKTLTLYGVTVPGGRAASVGVAGFLTGGGNSFHSATHGFGCDQVSNFEVVLASGAIVNANAHENTDLWIALKGGSGNFGIVTRFDMNTIPFANPDEPYIWGGTVGYNASLPGTTEAMVEEFVKFANNVDEDRESSTIVIWGYNGTALSIRVALENTANVPYAKAFDGMLRNVPGLTGRTLRSATMEDIAQELVRVRRTFTVWFTGSYVNDARIVQFIADRHVALVADLETLLGKNSAMFTSCQVQPLTRAMISHGQGNNVLGLEDRLSSEENDGKPKTGIMYLIYLGIDTKEQEVAATPLIRDFHLSVEEFANSIGGNLGWTYLNYANGEQDPVAFYGENAVSKIKAAAAKYDPKGVFQRLRGSGFKIPN